MSNKEKAVLRVSFDVDQISGDLLWRITDPDSGRNLLDSVGRFAGSVHFRHGDEVFVEVMATGRLGQFVTSRILAGHIVTRPHTTVESGSAAETFSAPSPFSNDAAVVAIPGWTPTQMVDDPVRGLRIALQQSTAPLSVIQRTGRWELSFVISVAIVQERDGERGESVRVFSFDPESEVGTGTDPN